MVAGRVGLEQAWFAAREVARRKEGNPISYVRWLPLQWSFLASDAKVKQIRAGNQTIGKSYCALAEVIGRCTGEHPLGESGNVSTYREPPIEAWIVCASWSQSLGIQNKLWKLLPKSRLLPSTRDRYSKASGFAPTKQPIVEFDNGSIIRIKTTGQDAIDFAGATIEVVLFDEPPKQPRMYTEALKRLKDLGGVLMMSYTPINAPVKYLRELVELGQIEDHWARLTPEQLIPVGCTEPLLAGDGTPKDAAWIAATELETPAHEIPVVVHGEWEMRASDAYFGPVFRKDVHIASFTPTGKWRLLLGIDHGHRPGKQCAPLVLARMHRGRPQVYVWDEYIDTTGTADSEGDATGIMAMLARHGWGWHNLDEVKGDRIHMKGTSSEKSNARLQEAIADMLDVDTFNLMPQIETAKRGEGHGGGSVEAGTRWLYHLMARAGAFHIHPRCVRGIQAIQQYVKPKDDEEGSKDWLDGLRYAVDRMIFDDPPGPQITVRLG